MKNSNLNQKETIAALATPTGRGAIGIVRVSGPKAHQIAQEVLQKDIPAKEIYYGSFYNSQKEVIDQGIVLKFNNPHSFTGEDVIEFQAHGGPIILQQLLQTTLDLGAKLAEPGEFSKQAYLNNKLDLAQAEAIADLIEASSEQAAKSALKSLQGDFSKEINQLIEQIIYLRTYVEASIDFVDEEIDFISEGNIAEQLAEIKLHLEKILQTAQQGAILREGISLVILGQPNAGKSSLLNALAGREAAIVTDIAGTTRDLVKEEINLDGLPIHLLDTAGLRATDDAIEQIGIERAWQALNEADRVLIILSDSQKISAEDQKIIDQLPDGLDFTLIHNKIDLASQEPKIQTQDGKTTIWLSAKHKLGLELLIEHLKEIAGLQTTEGTFTARKRHLEALKAAKQSIENAQEQLLGFTAGELVAEDLRQAQQDLSEITGEFTSDDLLGSIFSTFCIGK